MIVGIFGGNQFDENVVDQVKTTARALGEEVASTGWIPLTGGDDPKGRGVKNWAVSGVDRAEQRWIGITQAGHCQDIPVGSGRVIHTDLGNRRNYLEACLVDAALVLPGDKGTTSEAVAALCLAKPVVLVGEHSAWADKKGLGACFDQIATGKSLGETVRDELIRVSKKKLAEIPRSQIGRLIAHDVNSRRLKGRHTIARCTQTWEPKAAIDTLKELLSAGAPTSVWPDIGPSYEDLKRAFEAFAIPREL